LGKIEALKKKPKREEKERKPKKRRNKNAEKFFMTERFSDRLKKIKAGKKKEISNKNG